MIKLKVGVIGLGIGEQHIYGFQSCGCDVVALCDSDPAKRKMAADKFPECIIYDTAAELIENTEIDVVSIASFDQDHASQIVLAIRNGKHVFCEKPLCLKEHELDEIYIELVRRPQLRLSTNTVLRMSERFIEVKREITKGRLGQLYHVEADYNYGRLQKLMSGWRGDIKDYSVMLGGGIHMVDLLLWLLESPIVEVQAIGNKLCSANSSFSTPDLMIALLRFENGAIGKVAANFGCVYPHFHKVALYGTKGTFENDRSGGQFVTSRNPDEEPYRLTSLYPGAAKGDLIPSFVRAITGQGNSVVTEQDVFRAVSTCLAIDKSYRTKQTVQVKTYPNTLRKHA
tara:strand:- start:1648 stop:2673 length:1026 start_codon:yes stop_codon:yes gene_type:complete